MATLSNEERETLAIDAGDLLPYANLITPYPVWAVMFACGIERNNDRHKDVASGLFLDDYETCIDLNDVKLYNYHKMTSAQTVASGNRIRLTVPQRTKVRAFVQWTKDKIRTGQDPAIMKFELGGSDISRILRKAETHKLYAENSAANAVRPRDFTKEIKWADWAPSFENYLRAIPGRTGVPLSYVIRESVSSNQAPNIDFLDDYILNAPLSGADFLTDKRAVHTKLVALIATNPEAEVLIKLNEIDADGRKDWDELKLHYEGSGMHAIELKEAEKTLHNLVYQGEKPPQMYWTKFEQKLNTAFATYVKVEKRVVHSEQMKLSYLLNKIKCENLARTTVAIEALVEENGNYDYNKAIRLYKNAVAKFASRTNEREVKEQNQGRGRGGRNIGGRGRGSYSGRGRHGRGRGGYSGRSEFPNNVPKTVDGSTFFNLSDGTRIEYHPSIEYSPEVYNKFSKEEKDMLYNDRANGTVEGRVSYSNKRKIQEFDSLQQQNLQSESQTQDPEQSPADSRNSSAKSQVSQVTMSEGGSIMGGRVDQAQLRHIQSQSQGRGRGRYSGYGGRGGGRF